MKRVHACCMSYGIPAMSDDPSAAEGTGPGTAPELRITPTTAFVRRLRSSSDSRSPGPPIPGPPADGVVDVSPPAVDGVTVGVPVVVSPEDMVQ